MKLLLLKPNTQLSVINVGKGIDDYYKYLDCRCFGVVSVNGVDIYHDDEFLYTKGEDEHTLAIVEKTSNQIHTILRGNLIFASHNDEGETIALTEEQINMVEGWLRQMVIIGFADSKKKFAVPVALV